jgi:hypothetical protein
VWDIDLNDYKHFNAVSSFNPEAFVKNQNNREMKRKEEEYKLKQIEWSKKLDSIKMLSVSDINDFFKKKLCPVCNIIFSYTQTDLGIFSCVQCNNGWNWNKFNSDFNHFNTNMIDYNKLIKEMEQRIKDYINMEEEKEELKRKEMEKKRIEEEEEKKKLKELELIESHPFNYTKPDLIITPIIACIFVKCRKMFMSLLLYVNFSYWIYKKMCTVQ